MPPCLRLARRSASLPKQTVESFSIGKHDSHTKHLTRPDSAVSSFSEDMELIDMDLPQTMVNYTSCKCCTVPTH